MNFIASKKYRPYLVLILLVFFMITALTMRMIPALFIQDQGLYHNSGGDGLYVMRQIEVMVADFPHYNWYDPMTAYPYGKAIDWGPLYPVIAAALCLVLGASSRADIVYIAGWVSPLMATIMVPVTYKLGRILWNWKTGIVSAGLVSILNCVYFFQSSYGWIDHHIAETFFTTLFFLAYIYALVYIRKNPVDLNRLKTLVIPVILSGLAGFLYFLGYLASPTILLALLVVGIYTFVQFILDYVSGQRSEHILLLNILSFSCIAVFMTLFGFHQVGFSLATYSMGQVYVMLGLIAETVLFYILPRLFHKNRLHYFLTLGGVLIGGFVLIQILPAFQTIRDQAVSLLFGFSAYSVSVKETVPWTFPVAYEMFNVSFLLMAGGLIILVWYSVKKKWNVYIFLLIWFAVMLFLTVQFQRFQYYLTVPASLITAICITESVQWSWSTTRETFVLLFSRNSGKNERRPKRAVKGSGATIQPRAILKCITLVCVVILTITVVVISFEQDYAYTIDYGGREIPKDWIETLEWMKTSTPSPMVDYFQKYDRQTFAYPNASYGIMAPWEEGHRITFFTQRIPITSAFQDNLEGTTGVSAFFLSKNESSADTILSGFNGRYVVTDLSTATDTFPSLIPWVDKANDISPYIKWFFVQDPANPSRLTKTHLLDDAYFQTMVVRLQIFDGSMVLPDTAQYTQYIMREVPDSGETAGVNGLARVITGAQTVNASRDSVTVSPEGARVVPGVAYADIFSGLPYQPVKKVPALTHYRLVHESPNNISVMLNAGSGNTALPDIKSVKVFEHVKGAHIPGGGVIELSVITNTGRTFVYRQESAGGEFIVPYATTGRLYDIRAAGPYHIVGTTRYIHVTEEDVLKGNRVAGSG